jgi:hypothetical protein
MQTQDDFIDCPNRPKKPVDPDWRRSKRHSKKQIAEIIEVVKRLLMVGTRTRDIRAGLRASYNLKKRMAIKYVAVARASLLRETDLPKEDHIVSAYWGYKNVINDPEAGPREKREAWDSIVHMLGLAAPARHLIADVSPPKPAPSMLPEKRRALIENSKTRELLCQLCEASNALDLEPESKPPMLVELNQGSRLQLPSPRSTISN